MSGSWVAAATRGRGLLGDLVGPKAADEVACQSSLSEALVRLRSTLYGRHLAESGTLKDAQRAVSSATLWQLRVLAGWGPASGLSALRVVAARFEMENIVELVMRFDGDSTVPPPYVLGTLQTAWNRGGKTHGTAELRRVLRSSAWGDPGADGAERPSLVDEDAREELAQIAAQANAGGEPFKVVVAGMGLTHADAASLREALEERSSVGELALFLDTADDPVVQRILTPRVALTVAEHLAFDLGEHVLVILVDMTSYCEAVREVSAARGEIPGRRAYPGYLYSDLASLYERCGRIRGRDGSLTLLPVLTMPGGDITHPVADLTGYITEGQIVLSASLYGEGASPPVDILSSLSRLMRKGTGKGSTRSDHQTLAAQVVAAVAHAAEAADLADLARLSALTPTDRAYLDFEGTYRKSLVSQGRRESRTLDESLARAWRALSVLPRRELGMLAPSHIERFYGVTQRLTAGGDGDG